MMTQTMDLIDGATPCSRGAEVKEGIGSREPCGFPGNLQEAHPLWGETVWMGRVNEVHSIQNQMRVSQKSG